MNLVTHESLPFTNNNKNISLRLSLILFAALRLDSGKKRLVPSIYSEAPGGSRNCVIATLVETQS